MHIVVLSGFNITIIAQFIFILLGRFGARAAAGGAVTGVALFTLMAGVPATVLRGAIFVLTLMLGKLLGREGSAPRILLATAVLMLVWNPKMLVYDASFELSFLAMLGLIYAAPLVERWLAKVRLPALGRKGESRTIPPWLAGIMATTLGTQLAVFPFILYNMGNFSTVFLLSNLLVLAVIPATMLVGFIAALTAFISTALAWPAAFAAHILLEWILFVAAALGHFSFALVEIEYFPLWGSILAYILLGSAILWLSRDSLPRSAS